MPVHGALRRAFPAWVRQLIPRAVPMDPPCRVGRGAIGVSRFGHLQAACQPEFAPAGARPATFVAASRQIAKIIVGWAATYAQISCRRFVFMRHPGALSLGSGSMAKSLINNILLFCLFFQQPNHCPVAPRAMGCWQSLSTKLSTESVGKAGGLMNQGFSAVFADSHP